MFDYTFVHWSAFLAAAVLLNLSPGPDMAYILAQASKNGRRAGFAATFGIWSGAFIQVLGAALGLSAILATSATAFTIVKWAGAFYLIWLGYQALRSHGSSYRIDANTKPETTRRVFWQGVLVAMLNPKVALFFMAFLPQFVVEGAGPVSAQLLLHGSLIIVVAAFVEIPLVLVGAKLSRYLGNNTTVAAWLDRSLGALFIGLGIRLALSERG